MANNAGPLVTLGLVGALLTLVGSAQDQTAKALAERSAIVVAGKVLRVNASLEPMQPASAQTVVVTVTQMYAGADIAGDQKGRTITVVLSNPSRRLAPGTEALFFGNPRYIGNTLTIASEGELLSGATRGAGAPSAAAAEVSASVQTPRELPLRERIAAASSIFRGRVESERALPAGARPVAPAPPPSEHDPDWHVASVRVVTPMQGVEQGAVVTVMYPASRDIMWFSAPKLSVGQEAIFITHKADQEDAKFIRAGPVVEFLGRQPVEVVSQPLDALPVAQEARVRALAAARVR